MELKLQTKSARVSPAAYLGSHPKTLAASGVTRNAVSSGIILTQIVDDMFDKVGLENNIKIRAKMASEYAPNPLGRTGLPQEIADAVVFPASSRADYINGQNLSVDGVMYHTVN